MKIDIKSLDNKVIGQTELSADIFGVQPRKDILHRVVKWQLAKRRAGTHATKTISEVSGTTKKPFAQKGTGRARQGSMRSAQMVGGGVSFGPVVRDHGYDLQKKVRAMGLKMAFASKVLDNKLIVLESVKIDAIKTKTVAEKLVALGAEKPLFITKKDEDKNFNASIQNLICTDIIPVEGANVYDILKHKTLFVTIEALKGINERLAKYPTARKSVKTEKAPAKKVAKAAEKTAKKATK